MWVCLSRAWAWAKVLWGVLHIEHKGFYSLERLQLLRHFISRSNSLHNSLVVAVMPLPTLSVILLCDCIPLAAPSAGVTANYAYWGRAWIVIAAFTAAVFGQVYYCVRQLPPLWPHLLTMIAAIASSYIAIHFALSMVIGFPIPFGYLVMNVPWISLIGAAMWIHMGKQCRDNPCVRSDLKQYGIVIYVASSLAVVYPLFYHLFLLLKGDKTGQFLFTFLLPVIKLLEKFLVNHFSKFMEDMQPTLISFNVEVFNSLFVSCCMQNANSLGTSVALMGMDFLGAMYSLYSLRNFMPHIDELSAKMGVSRDQMLHVTDAIIRANPDAMQWRRTPISIAGFPNKHAVAGELRKVDDSNVTPMSTSDHAPVLQSFPQQRILSVHRYFGRILGSVVSPIPENQLDLQDPNGPGSPSKFPSHKLNAVVPAISVATDTCGRLDLAKVIERLSLKERKKFVKETLKVLRRTEFLLLVEYTEVIVPIVYCESRSVPLACRTRSPTCSC
jgi:hypothetical protein